MRDSFAFKYGAIGTLLGLGAPAGLFVVLSVASPDPDALLTWVYLYCGIATTVVFGGFGMVLGRLSSRLESAALRDPLTGLFNRRYLDESQDGIADGCARRGEPLSILMMDLDHFKRVNDNFGHRAGDQTLRAVARVIQRSVRVSDVACRYGGEEFIALCQGADAAEAYDIAERIRQGVAELGEKEIEFPGRITLSVGVVCIGIAQVASMNDAIQRADEALYKAKAQGRDRTVVESLQAPVFRQ